MGGAVTGAGAGHRAAVVVPLHNHAGWIGPLLESMFAQWRPHFALLIIDDASTDGSFDAALRALQSRPDISAIVLRNERPLHHGVAAQAVQFTSSPVIIKADSDDVALPGRLDALLDAFEADPSCRLVTSNAVLLNAEGVPAGLYDADTPDMVVDDPAHWAGTHGSNLWLGATMAFHRTLLTGFPPVDPELCPYGLDIVLAFRATLLGTHRYIARPLVGWRQHGRNAHRVAGVLSFQPGARENYAALEAMAMAQRLRDARHAAATDQDPARLADAIGRCTATFFDRYDTWCRLRHRVAEPPGEASQPDRVPPVPPVATLGLGRHLFGKAGLLGTVAAGWNGFYAPEESWTWTSAAALIAIRVAPAVNCLSLTVAGQLWQDGQPISVSVNLGSRVQARLSGTDQLVLEVPVPDRWDADLILLLIEAPEASYSGQATSSTSDVRRLGLMLESLELTCSGDH